MVPQLRSRGAGTPATVALDRAGVRFTLHPYEHDPAATSYGAAAADALGLSPAEVFKTLLVVADGAPVVAVIPVASTLDLKAVARAVGSKRAAMADPEVAERLTGYVVGGISPIGQRTRLRTVLDESAADLGTVYVSAGRRGVSLGITPDALAAVTGAELAPIARG